jgi:hypothetical protein
MRLTLFSNASRMELAKGRDAVPSSTMPARMDSTFAASAGEKKWVLYEPIALAELLPRTECQSTLPLKLASKRSIACRSNAQFGVPTALRLEMGRERPGTCSLIQGPIRSRLTSDCMRARAMVRRARSTSSSRMRSTKRGWPV